MRDRNDTQGLGALVLAAGGAAERPAAPAAWHGATPVCGAARAAVEAGLWPVVVVVGPGDEVARAALAGLPVATVLDDGPHPDLASGVRRGLARLRECAPGLRGVAILDCAAPAADAAHLAALAAALQAGGRPLVASARDAALGLPVLLAAELLPELAALAAGEGAAELLARDPGRVTPVPHAPAR